MQLAAPTATDMFKLGVTAMYSLERLRDAAWRVGRSRKETFPRPAASLAPVPFGGATATLGCS